MSVQPGPRFYQRGQRPHVFLWCKFGAIRVPLRCRGGLVWGVSGVPEVG